MTMSITAGSGLQHARMGIGLLEFSHQAFGLIQDTSFHDSGYAARVPNILERVSVQYHHVSQLVAAIRSPRTRMIPSVSGSPVPSKIVAPVRARGAPLSAAAIV